MRHLALFRFGVVASLAAAIALGPMQALAQSSSVQITIDAPTAGATVANGDVVDFGGWALDNAAVGGTGIDGVDIYVDVQNGVAGTKISANYGTFRPDVARAFGRSDWTNSGFNLNWTVSGLSDGQHTFQVWAHSPTQGWRSSNVTLAVSGTRMASPPSLPAPIGVIQPQPMLPPSIAQPPFVPPMAQPPIPPAMPNGPVIACLADQTAMMMGAILVPC